MNMLSPACTGGAPRDAQVPRKAGSGVTCICPFMERTCRRESLREALRGVSTFQPRCHGAPGPGQGSPSNRIEHSLLFCTFLIRSWFSEMEFVKTRRRKKLS